MISALALAAVGYGPPETGCASAKDRLGDPPGVHPRRSNLTFIRLMWLRPSFGSILDCRFDKRKLFACPVFVKYPAVNYLFPLATGRQPELPHEWHAILAKYHGWYTIQPKGSSYRLTADVPQWYSPCATLRLPAQKGPGLSLVAGFGVSSGRAMTTKPGCSPLNNRYPLYYPCQSTPTNGRIKSEGRPRSSQLLGRRVHRLNLRYPSRVAAG